MRLGDAAEYVGGITFTPSDVVLPGSPDAVVCMRTKNVQAELDTRDLIAVPRKFVRRDDQLLREGDILVSSANSWNLVGKCCYVPRLEYPAALGGFISLLRPNPLVANPKYLYRWLAWEETQREVRALARQTTNIANLPRERFLDLDAPLPALPEQSRIAAILDEADALRRKRREALGLLDDLLRATFLEMFGDPVTNPMGWAERPLQEVISSIEPGWSSNSLDHPAGPREWGVLKVSAVSTGLFLEAENKAVESPVFARPPVTPRRGDLLFSRANTRELVAATCLVSADAPRRFLPDKLWRIACHPDRARVEWLRFLLAHPAFHASLTKTATGTSGSMLNVSQDKLLDMVAPVPPVPRQRQFADVVWAAMAERSVVDSALTATEKLFSSLLYRAFSRDFGAPIPAGQGTQVAVHGPLEGE